MSTITIDDVTKVEIKVGIIVSAVEVEGSNKLLKLSVDFGEENPRTVFSGIRKHVLIENILNRQFLFITNLEPREMMGEFSQAMILAGGEGDEFALMTPTAPLKNGTTLR